MPTASFLLCNVKAEKNKTKNVCELLSLHGWNWPPAILQWARVPKNCARVPQLAGVWLQASLLARASANTPLDPTWIRLGPPGLATRADRFLEKPPLNHCTPLSCHTPTLLPPSHKLPTSSPRCRLCCSVARRAGWPKAWKLAVNVRVLLF